MTVLELMANIYDKIRIILDVSVLSFVLYKVYMIIKKTNGSQLIKAAVIFGVSYALALILKLDVLLWLLNFLTPSLIIAFAIVFQPELRNVFLKLGQFSFVTRSKHTHVDSVLSAAEELSRERRGMLAVFMRHSDFKDRFDKGTKLNADLSSALLVTIFKYDTPLHDGAVFIRGGKIVAAGCFLPLSDQYDIKKTFGTRHRAALGIAEQSDAIVLVVSEETGAISLAYDSKLYYNLSKEQLEKTLAKQLNLSQEISNKEEELDGN
ncbi:MAG: diadenylate cyclase CdaA [Spirochaetaceae bacterium]|nr:diadenylate cyclase CdaA [Spirochaetaceae bacterium]